MGPPAFACRCAALVLLLATPLPGWTQQRQNEQRPGRPEFGPDMAALWRAPSDNVLMVKVSDWLSR